MTAPLVRAAAICAALLIAAPQAGAEELRGYTYTVASQPSYQSLERIGKTVAEQTGNRITMKFNPGGSLPIPTAGITQALGDGLIGVAGDGFYTSSLPVGGIAFLPMLFATREEFEAGFTALEPYLASGLEKLGIKLIGHYYYPLQTAFARVKLESLDDFKGKKVRTTSTEQAEFVKRLGGLPVTIGTPEVATSLQRGVIDVIFTASSGGARTYHEMLTHNLRIGPNFHLSLIGVNLDKFRKFKPEDQKVLLAAGREHGAWATAQYVELEEKFKNDYRKAGMVVTEPDAAAVTRASAIVRDYWDQWAAQKGGAAQEALRAVRTAIKK